MHPRNIIDSHLIIYQNPVLLTNLIYSFLETYAEERNSCDIVLVYYIVPLLLINDYWQVLNSTQPRSGLDKFLIKFNDQNNRDLLLRLKYDAQRCFKLASKAIFIGHACNFFSVNSSNASLSPLPISKQLKIPPTLRGKAANAKKLGIWLSKYSGVEAVSILSQGK